MKTKTLQHAVFSLFALSVLVFSCQKDEIPLPDEPSDIVPIVEDISKHLNLTDESPDFEARVLLVNEPVILADTSLGRNACTNYGVWSHVAEIVTLTHGGEKLSATHVAMVGDLAVVSYHLRGNAHKGAVEVIDLKDPLKPKINSQAIFNDADVNAVTIEANETGGERRIWVALSDATNGAVLGELVLKSKKFKSGHYRQSKLTYSLAGGISSSANDIAEAGNFLYVTSGRSSGGVYCVHKQSLAVIGVKEFTHAKGVAVNGGTVGISTVCAVQTNGTPGIYKEVVGESGFVNRIDISPITHQNVEDEEGGKVAIAFTAPGSNHVLLAGGTSGMQCIDVSSNSLVFSSPETMLKNGNTNGITIDDSFVYLANGADGLAIFPKGANGLPETDQVFLWDMNEPSASANFVASSGKFVFVAKGEGGFKVLKKPGIGDSVPTCNFDDDGVPECLANDVTICRSLPARINTALPMDAQTLLLHPEYFISGLTEISIKEETRLKLTFMEENSNYKNSLGYYFYPEDCPPASKDDQVGLLLFPNFSAIDSKGSLEAGNTVKLPGTFKTGTRVGFFFLKNGFNGGHSAYYSQPSYNPALKQHALLFFDSECGDIIGAFEENPPTSSNANFRDMLFKITPAFPSAIDGSEYLNL